MSLRRTASLPPEAQESLEISEAFQEVRNLKFQCLVPEAYVTACYRYHTTSKVSETLAFTEDYLVVKGTLGATVGAT